MPLSTLEQNIFSVSSSCLDLQNNTVLSEQKTQSFSATFEGGHSGHLKASILCFPFVCVIEIELAHSNTGERESSFFFPFELPHKKEKEPPPPPPFQCYNKALV